MTKRFIRTERFRIGAKAGDKLRKVRYKRQRRLQKIRSLTTSDQINKNRLAMGGKRRDNLYLNGRMVINKSDKLNKPEVSSENKNS